MVDKKKRLLDGAISGISAGISYLGFKLLYKIPGIKTTANFLDGSLNIMQKEIGENLSHNKISTENLDTLCRLVDSTHTDLPADSNQQFYNIGQRIDTLRRFYNSEDDSQEFHLRNELLDIRDQVRDIQLKAKDGYSNHVATNMILGTALLLGFGYFSLKRLYSAVKKNPIENTL